MLCFAACISNDVPYPVIYGNVTKIEFNGQQKSVINTKTRTIELTLSDTVDIYAVRLNVLELSADPARAQDVFVEAEATIAPDTVVDLSKPFRFKVRTYREYEWTITAEQPVERWFKIDPAFQVGDEVINAQKRHLIVYIGPKQDPSNIEVMEYRLGPSIATYEPDPYDLTDFTKQQVINVTCFGRTEPWVVTVENKHEEEGGKVTVDAWARFANVSARMPSGVNGTPVFEYKQSGRGKWKSVEAEVSGQVFQAKITGLTANKDYVVRSVVGENVSEEVSFTTEREEQIPYSNFDTWYTDDDAKSLCVGLKGLVTWDSGNKGANTVSAANPTAPDYTNKVDLPGNEAAAYLETKAVVGVLAAGNLYTGSYGKTVGTAGAKLNFGIPYTLRPTVLKGYYMYQPQPIDKTKSPYDNLKGKTDSCYIYVALFDWNTAFEADNSLNPPKLIDLSTALAFGELKTDRSMDSFEPFEIEIKYMDLTKRPTYILVVASASKYGDYFTGGVGSKLWIDEFELGFD